MEGPEARLNPESRSKARTEAQRDRDRVLYSTAFRRLSGITQVASPQTGQLLHSRLTHTLKVAQIARRMAERLVKKHGDSLSLDPDVVEAGAFIHDIGHPPFGHIGEQVLDRENVSFEGNAQSFRIVTCLSRRSLDYHGLNLTRGVLNAALKYPWKRAAEPGAKHDKWGVYGQDEDTFTWARAELGEPGKKTLEAQIMDWADDVTYATHDLEDFFRAGLVPLERLSTTEEEMSRFLDSTLGEDRRTPTKRISRELGEGAVLTCKQCEELQAEAEWLFGNLLVTKVPYDGTEASRVKASEMISALIGDLFEAAELSEDLMRLEATAESRRRIAILKELTWQYVIERPSLAREQKAQRRVLSELVEILSHAMEERDWRLFPDGVAEVLRAEQGDDNFKVMGPRTVTDYVAGMSEGEVIQTHRSMTIARLS